MKARLYQHIRKKELFNHSDKLLLAVSGGMDSMLLLHLLHQQYPKLAVAHCNFQLREEESDGDEAFVRESCQALGVTCFVKRFNTSLEAGQMGLTIQETARALRYAWFESMLGERGFDLVLTAHHADDQVETFFLNVYRASGSLGLSGIPERRGAFVRPLLPFKRKEIEACAKKEGVLWREDSSNAKSVYRRNALRLEILPAMETHFPDFSDKVLSAMAHLREENAFIDGMIQGIEAKALEENKQLKVLDLSVIKRYPQASFILYRILSAYGFRREQTDAMYKTSESDHTNGQQFDAADYRVLVDRGKLRLMPKQEEREERCLWQKDTKVSWRSMSFGMHNLREKAPNPRVYSGNRALVSAASLRWPLLIRSWQEGDRMHPLGMKGKKLLSDLFVDAKIPLDQKKEIPVIEDADGRIIWVVGLRLSEEVRWREGGEGVVLEGGES